jgi:hypothetical protein
MSRTISYYCSCSTCTQIRNEQPKHYRYINSLRYFLTRVSCIPQKKRFSSTYNSRTPTITFRDTDITNKHCSKHDVMIKASRPNFSKLKNEELRQRVKDANQRWTRMSVLPANLIDYIFQNQDFMPLCRTCYRNLSLLTFNLCHMCLTNIINYQQQIQNERKTLSIISNSMILDRNDENIERVFFDYISENSFSV